MIPCLKSASPDPDALTIVFRLMQARRAAMDELQEAAKKARSDKLGIDGWKNAMVTAKGAGITLDSLAWTHPKLHAALVQDYPHFESANALFRKCWNHLQDKAIEAWLGTSDPYYKEQYLPRKLKARGYDIRKLAEGRARALKAAKEAEGRPPWTLQDSINRWLGPRTPFTVAVSPSPNANTLTPFRLGAPMGHQEVESALQPQQPSKAPQAPKTPAAPASGIGNRKGRHSDKKGAAAVAKTKHDRMKQSKIGFKFQKKRPNFKRDVLLGEPPLKAPPALVPPRAATFSSLIHEQVQAALSSSSGTDPNMPRIPATPEHLRHKLAPEDYLPGVIFGRQEVADTSSSAISGCPAPHKPTPMAGPTWMVSAVAHKTKRK